MLQAYEGYLEEGRFFPIGPPDILRGRRRVIVTLLEETIPEGSDVTVTVLAAPLPDNELLMQQCAVNEFLESICNCDEPLSPEFDEVISQRFNISRELEV